MSLDITKEWPCVPAALKQESKTVTQCMYWAVERMLEADRSWDGGDYAPSRQNKFDPCGDCDVCREYSRLLEPENC